jgi:predicted DNA-binding transcriptional regulator AlpA
MSERSKRLLPEPQVLQRYGVSAMTTWRWDNDPNLGFPKPIYIRGRKYRDERELDAFDESRKRKADARASAANGSQEAPQPCGRGRLTRTGNRFTAGSEAT